MSKVGRVAVITGPAKEPLTLLKAQNHLRIFPDDIVPDDLINDLILTARVYIEDFLGRTLIEKALEMSFDGFPISSFDKLQLERPNLIAVQSVQYFDELGVIRTWESTLYQVNIFSTLGFILPIPNETYPATQQGKTDSVVIRFRSGYGLNASDVPPTIIHAMKLMVGELYNRREEAIVGAAINVVPLSIQRLIAPYRIYNF